MNSKNSYLEEFRGSGALLDGHFVLSSGLHSSQYLQCAIALQESTAAIRYGRDIAEKFRGSGIQTVASPAIGGLVIGFATAAALGVRFIWTERENGIMTLRRGFDISPAEKILVVEDVITTGGSTRECMEALRQRGAEIVGAASIVDRSNGRADVGVSRISLISLDVPTYKPTECPLCAAGEEPVKPGSRTVAKA